MKRGILALVAASVTCLLCGDAEAVISIIVTPSRTSCAAPCAISFDATTSTGLSGSLTTYAGPTSTGTTGDYVKAAWTWNFDSTNISSDAHKTQTAAFAAAHVFETVGTYTVLTSVTDASGATAGPVSTTITISAMSGTTYYASSGGSGTTCSFASPCSATTALTHAATNNTIAFRNGDTFTMGSSLAFSNLTGPVNFTIYNPGSNTTPPVLNFSSNAIDVSGTSSDLRFIGITTAKPSGTTGGAVTIMGAVDGNPLNTLLLRCDISTDTATAAEPIIQSNNLARGMYVFDSHLHHVTGYGWYGDGVDHAFMYGTLIDDLANQYHGVRWQSCNETGFPLGSCPPGYDKAVLSGLAYNTFDNTASFTSWEFHGDSTNFYSIYNVQNNNSGIGPQNTTAVEYLSNMLVEGNDFRTNGSTGTSFSTNARHIVFRNNVMTGTFSGAYNTGSATQLTAGWTTEHYVYANTFHGATPMVSWGSGTGTVDIADNIYYATGSSGSFLSCGSGTCTESYNNTYAPGFSMTHPSGAGDIYGNPLFTTTPPLVAADVILQSSSPAKDAGTTLTNYVDFTGVTRTGTFDIGAREYISGVLPSGKPASEFYLFVAGNRWHRSLGQVTRLSAGH